MLFHNLICCRCMAIYNSSNKEKCLMVAMLASAGLGEVAQYESARAELTAINPAWPKAALFTTVMPFIFNYVH